MIRLVIFLAITMILVGIGALVYVKITEKEPEPITEKGLVSITEGTPESPIKKEPEPVVIEKGSEPISKPSQPPTGQAKEMIDPIISAPPPLEITRPLPNQEFQAYAGEQVSFVVEATGGTLGFSCVAEGLSGRATFEPDTGEFRWTPVGAPGKYPATLKVTDNEGKSATVPVTINILEPGDIELTINSPKEGYLTKEQQVTIRGTIEYKWLNRLDLADGMVLKPMDDVSRALTPNPNKAKASFQYIATLKEGANQIVVSASDSTHHKEGFGSVTVIRDTTPPYFISDGERKTEIRFNETRIPPVFVKVVDETSPIDKVSASWSSAIQQPNKRQNEYSMEIQASELKLGENQLMAYDQLGIPSEPLLLIKIPELKIEVTTPKPNEIVNKERIAIKGVVTGGSGGITLTVGNQRQPLSQGNFTVEVPLQNEGKNSVHIKAQDKLGETTLFVLTITKDTVGPVFTYKGRLNKEGGVPVVERIIAGGNFVVEIDEQNALDSVRLNGKEISANGKTVEIVLNDLKQDEANNLVGMLTAKDIAGNEATLKIVVKPDPGVTKLWEEQFEALKEKRYNDALNTIEAIEKTSGLNASVLLFRGINTYFLAKALKDMQKSYDQLDVAINHLNNALSRAETYPKGKDNIHLNRYHLGMCYYERMYIAKQMEWDEATVKQNANYALDALDLFLYHVGDRVPELKQEAERVVKEIQ
jgi:hypothetical protein